MNAEEEYAEILKRKIKHYGSTEAAYEFAALEFAKHYHAQQSKGMYTEEELEKAESRGFRRGINAQKPE